jgi:hypothetical protein
MICWRELAFSHLHYGLVLRDMQDGGMDHMGNAAGMSRISYMKRDQWVGPTCNFMMRQLHLCLAVSRIESPRL